MSLKAFNSFLFSPGPNIYFEPLDVNSDESSVVRVRPVCSRPIRNFRKKVPTKILSLNRTSNELKVYTLQISEPVIRPEIYALAALGRDEPDHELQGSTREELRASLKRALQQMPGWFDLKRIPISGVKFSNRYKSTSNKLGYDSEEYIDDVLDLYLIWNNQKYIDIYESHLERAYGRAKDSNSKPGSTPFYIDLYHARAVRGENDPLVLLEFKSVEGNDLPILIIKFLVHHDDIFGTKADKENRQVMFGIRKTIDAYRRESDD